MACRCDLQLAKWLCATVALTRLQPVLQSTKWHLYAQRRAEERIRQRQEGATP